MKFELYCRPNVIIVQETNNKVPRIEIHKFPIVHRVILLLQALFTLATFGLGELHGTMWYGLYSARKRLGLKKPLRPFKLEAVWIKDTEHRVFRIKEQTARIPEITFYYADMYFLVARLVSATVASITLGLVMFNCCVWLAGRRAKKIIKDSY